MFLTCKHHELLLETLDHIQNIRRGLGHHVILIREMKYIYINGFLFEQSQTKKNFVRQTKKKFIILLLYIREREREKFYM